jgi:hypothetical protein
MFRVAEIALDSSATGKKLGDNDRTFGPQASAAIG